MPKNNYDVLIAGGGPIGAATAYFLTKSQPELSIGLVTLEPTDDPRATYLQAGGSLRWIWSDENKSSMTQETAKLIKDLSNRGVDLSLIEDHYAYLYTGEYHPSLNFSGKKLVEYLLAEAEKSGLEIIHGAEITAVQSSSEGNTLTTSQGEITGKKLLMALGYANKSLLMRYELELEKRQLFVIDTPVKVDADTEVFPHTIGRIGDDGYVYVFVKQTPEGLRYVVGQEDVIEDLSEDAGTEDYFARLVAAGAGDIFPFLKKANVEKIWWGFDAGNKALKCDDLGNGLYAANCGSAARSAAWIGRTLAERLAN